MIIFKKTIGSQVKNAAPMSTPNHKEIKQAVPKRNTINGNVYHIFIVNNAPIAVPAIRMKSKKSRKASTIWITPSSSFYEDKK